VVVAALAVVVAALAVVVADPAVVVAAAVVAAAVVAAAVVVGAVVAVLSPQAASIMVSSKLKIPMLENRRSLCDFLTCMINLSLLFSGHLQTMRKVVTKIRSFKGQAPLFNRILITADSQSDGRDGKTINSNLRKIMERL
jgi:hypothetical protein